MPAHTSPKGQRVAKHFIPAVMAMACWLAATATPARASETTIADNTSLSSAGTNEVSGDAWLAASFTVDALDGEGLLATLVGSTQAGSASLALYSSDASGLIPDSALATFTAVNSTDGTLNFSLSGLTLGSGTYWAVLSNATGSSEWSWTADSVGAGTGFTGAWANSDDAGVTWFSNSTLYPLQLRMAVSTVPEPGSWLLGLVGLIGVAGLTGMRRTAQASR